jgi:hypothetical protein
MPLTVIDPRTGMRVTPAMSSKPAREQRARRWVLRELDRQADRQKQASNRSS